jgi:transcriptional regulator with XRE-family HTH domain
METAAGQPETIGALIARVRAEQGVTQLRLAARLCASAGVSTVTRHEVSRWEREERIPTGYWLSWLALALDTPLEALERAAATARRQRRHVARARWRAITDGVYRRVAS